ncbi:LysR family transcriptional regulator [Paraburkholderia acidicola]|uniref:LysR family transcriptional regulator n=1 Tax=Paraburkholderia acidicola TaxID=1912599 RepID=A0A2A4EN90_9BURK|nr:LysR family transcriptional regulator [Paraburkholderia acidicola]PCE21872.1 LysR family transcriptional regulator [Paraburkholderia acidicola]
MLRELKTFVAVAQHGTFAAAGERIGLTQSAVSAQMQRLEKNLGFALFDRTGRSATLNDAGRETLALADDLLSLYAQLGGQATPAAERGGTLTVGAIASVQPTFMADALANFRHDWPGWRLRIVPGVSLNLLGQVDAGELDLAVIIKPPFSLPPDLECRTLVTEPFVLLVPARLARRPWRELLASEPFIRYDRRSFGGGQVDRFLRRLRVNVSESIELDELLGIVQLVARGAGVALVPLAAAFGTLPRTVKALALGGETFEREIVLVERRRRATEAPAARLGECIAEAAQALAGKNRRR